MNKSPPTLTGCGKRHPVALDAMKEKVVEDVLSPGGEGATLWTTFSKDGEKSLAGEALTVHSREVAEPTEATSAKQGLNGDEATGFTHRDVSDVAVGGVGDAQHVPGTAHLETFQTAHVKELRGPGL